MVQAQFLEAVPNLDGDVLGDDAWKSITATTGFFQTKPDDGLPGTQKTEVYIGFIDDTLYIGAVLYDDEPSRIIVADSRRDSSLTDTDSFRVILDTFHDGQNGLVFGTNAAGIEYDGQVTKEAQGGRFSSGSGGFNLNWDTSWSVASRISDHGWSAEFAIPVKSLRYGKGARQTWGINFQRNIRRNNEQAYWVELPRQYNLFYRVSLAGTLAGLTVPPQRNLKITPYALGRANRGGPLSSRTRYDQEFGVDAKYSLTPGLTLDATYNTDFAQVEADEIQVNLDRFSLFFEEKRPFFLENAGQFSVGKPREVELFFSRRIGIGAGGKQTPIVGGLRLSGKIRDHTNIGVLQMRSEAVTGAAPRNDFTVVRVSQELANRSSIGVIAINRDGDGSFETQNNNDYNRSYGIDGRLGVGEDTTFSGWVAKTDTPDRKGDDHALGLKAEHNSEKWFNNVSYAEVAEDFNPEVGFLSRQSYRKFSGLLFRRIRPENLLGLHEIRPHISTSNYYDYEDGFHESTLVHLDSHFEWTNGIEIHTGVNYTHEGVRETFQIVDGIDIDPGKYRHQELQLVFLTDEAKKVSFDVFSKIGGRFGGDRVSVAPTLNYRLSEKFTSEIGWSYNDFDLPNGNFEVNVGKLRTTYSFSPKISIQALFQYDDRDNVFATNLRFAWLQSANTGFFLVYNELDDEDLRGERQREIILKFSHIFDVL